MDWKLNFGVGREVKSRGGRIAQGLFFVVFSLVFIAWPLGTFVETVQRYLHWPLAQAVVTGIEGGTPHDERIVVRFAYDAGGTTHTGELSADESDEADFARLAATYTVGQSFPVYYDPADPQAHSLRHAPEVEHLGISCFGLAFTVIGVWTALAALRGVPEPKQSHATIASAFVLALSGFGVFGLARWLDWPGSLLALGLPVAGLLAVRGVVRWHRARPPGDRPPLGADSLAMAFNAPWLYDTRMQRILLPLVTVIWWGFTGPFLGVALHSLWQSHDAMRRFASVEGEIVRSRIVSESDSDRTLHRPFIKYRYIVDGREYVSTSYAAGSEGTSSDSVAGDIVQRYRPGQRVTVWYDPDDPARSVLRREPYGLQFFALLFTQPFLLIGLGLAGAAVLAYVDPLVPDFLGLDASRVRRIPTWGPLRRTPDGLVIANRRWTRVWTAFAVPYGAVTFASVFIVGIGFAFGASGESLGVFAWVFGIALFAGGVAAIRQLLRTPACLRIDTQRDELEMRSPRGSERVALRDVAGWVVRSIPTPRLTKRSVALPTVPLLAARTADGTEIPIHVFRPDDNGTLIAGHTAHLLAAATSRPIDFSPTPLKDPPIDEKESRKRYGDLT